MFTETTLARVQGELFECRAVHLQLGAEVRRAAAASLQQTQNQSPLRL